MLDLRRLEVLQRFAVCGSITATADDLGYSPSAVSQQLATLEREAGVALLERTAHSASLTDAGHELVDQAGLILGAVEEAVSRMRARAGVVSGRVRVSCITGMAALLAPHLAGLQRQHPRLTIVARETGSAEAIADLLDRSTDLSVVDDWTQNPAPSAVGVTVHRLRTEPVVLAVHRNHPYAGRRTALTPSALRDVVRTDTWLCASIGQLSRAAGDRRLAEIDAVPVRRWQFDGLNIQASLVEQDAGVALLPDRVVAQHPDLVGLPLTPGLQRHLVALTRATTHADPALAACLRAAHQAVGLE